ncbi:MAG: hypothetical protein NTU41_04300 [Chloroflexi bacterium]|nr:hypothetical protein [Chloroflexota bacterium]
MSRTVSRLALILFLAIACLCLAGSCGSSADNTNGTASPAENEYAIDISLNGEHVSSVTLTELHALAQTSFEAGGNTQSGPEVATVLEYAGIIQYSQITVAGMARGRTATAELTLGRAEVTDQVVLAFNKQGKTKLAGQDIPQDSWIIDVSEIRAE